MRRQCERGSVTILVLWGIAIVFALLAAASFTTRTELLIARNEISGLRVREAAEGGTQLGLARLLARRAAGDAIFAGTPETWRDGEASVAISIQDEAGKIDLNQAPVELLQGLFRAVGRNEDESLLLACGIVARRGQLAPPCPASAFVAGSSAPIAAPEEIADLPGMSAELYDAIADFVTVASGAGAIDPAVAPRTVLLALPGASRSLVDEFLAARPGLLEMAPQSSLFEALPGYAYLMVSPVRDFTVSAVASLPDGANYRADLQLRLTGQPRRPYRVYAWRTPAPRR